MPGVPIRQCLAQNSICWPASPVAKKALVNSVADFIDARVLDCLLDGWLDVQA